MKHSSKFHSIGVSAPADSSVDIENSNEFVRPLSYHLNGGIDLEGDALATTNEVEFDTEEQANDIIAEGASSVAFGDPKQSKFRLVETLGAKAAESAIAGEQTKGAESTE